MRIKKFAITVKPFDKPQNDQNFSKLRRGLDNGYKIEV